MSLLPQSSPDGAHCFTVRASISVSVCMRRLLRLAFWVRAESMWRLKPGPAFTLPVAVILNRFLTDDLVFILGIWFSFLAAACGERSRSRPGMPISGPDAR